MNIGGLPDRPRDRAGGAECNLIDPLPAGIGERFPFAFNVGGDELAVIARGKNPLSVARRRQDRALMRLDQRFFAAGDQDFAFAGRNRGALADKMDREDRAVDLCLSAQRSGPTKSASSSAGAPAA